MALVRVWFVAFGEGVVCDLWWGCSCVLWPLFVPSGCLLAAEKAEQITYNSLPATMTPDMWAHQYLQQGNEMNAVYTDNHVWFSDGPDATE